MMQLKQKNIKNILQRMTERYVPVFTVMCFDACISLKAHGPISDLHYHKWFISIGVE